MQQSNQHYLNCALAPEKVKDPFEYDSSDDKDSRHCLSQEGDSTNISSSQLLPTTDSGSQFQLSTSDRNLSDSQIAKRLQEQQNQFQQQECPILLKSNEQPPQNMNQQNNMINNLNSQQLRNDQYNSAFSNTLQEQSFQVNQFQNYDQQKHVQQPHFGVQLTQSANQQLVNTVQQSSQYNQSSLNNSQQQANHHQNPPQVYSSVNNSSQLPPPQGNQQLINDSQYHQQGQQQPLNSSQFPSQHSLINNSQYQMNHQQNLPQVQSLAGKGRQLPSQDKQYLVNGNFQAAQQQHQPPFGSQLPSQNTQQTINWFQNSLQSQQQPFIQSQNLPLDSQQFPYGYQQTQQYHQQYVNFGSQNPSQINNLSPLGTYYQPQLSQQPNIGNYYDQQNQYMNQNSSNLNSFRNQNYINSNLMQYSSHQYQNPQQENLQQLQQYSNNQLQTQQNIIQQCEQRQTNQNNSLQNNFSGQQMNDSDQKNQGITQFMVNSIPNQNNLKNLFDESNKFEQNAINETYSYMNNLTTKLTSNDFKLKDLRSLLEKEKKNSTDYFTKKRERITKLISNSKKPEWKQVLKLKKEKLENLERITNSLIFKCESCYLRFEQVLQIIYEKLLSPLYLSSNLSSQINYEALKIQISDMLTYLEVNEKDINEEYVNFKYQIDLIKAETIKLEQIICEQFKSIDKQSTIDQLDQDMKDKDNVLNQEKQKIIDQQKLLSVILTEKNQTFYNIENCKFQINEFKKSELEYNNQIDQNKIRIEQINSSYSLNDLRERLKMQKQLISNTTQAFQKRQQYQLELRQKNEYQNDKMLMGNVDMKSNSLENIVNVLICDVSGSMSGKPFDFLSKSVLNIIQKLQSNNPDEFLIIIYFNSQATVVQEFTQVKNININELRPKILKFSGGGTSINAALQKTLEQLNSQKKILPIIQFITDAEDSDPKIYDTLANMKKMYPNLILFGTAYGDNVDINQMKKIVNQANNSINQVKIYGDKRVELLSMTEDPEFIEKIFVQIQQPSIDEIKQIAYKKIEKDKVIDEQNKIDYERNQSQIKMQHDMLKQIENDLLSGEQSLELKQSQISKIEQDNLRIAEWIKQNRVKLLETQTNLAKLEEQHSQLIESYKLQNQNLQEQEKQLKEDQQKLNKEKYDQRQKKFINSKELILSLADLGFQSYEECISFQEDIANDVFLQNYENIQDLEKRANQEMKHIVDNINNTVNELKKIEEEIYKKENLLEYIIYQIVLNRIESSEKISFQNNQHFMISYVYSQNINFANLVKKSGLDTDDLIRYFSFFTIQNLKENRTLKIESSLIQTIFSQDHPSKIYDQKYYDDDKIQALECQNDLLQKQLYSLKFEIDTFNHQTQDQNLLEQLQQRYTKLNSLKINNQDAISQQTALYQKEIYAQSKRQFLHKNEYKLDLIQRSISTLWPAFETEIKGLIKQSQKLKAFNLTKLVYTLIGKHSLSDTPTIQNGMQNLSIGN